MPYFHTLPTSASALPCRTGNCIFLLKQCTQFFSNRLNSLKLSTFTNSVIVFSLWPGLKVNKHYYIEFFLRAAIKPHVGPRSCSKLPLLLHFQAGGPKRSPNLALVFMFILCHSVFLMNVCFCCVTFSFFSTRPRDWLGRTLPK